MPVGGRSLVCAFDMVWYSAHACPLCTQEDYEMVTIAGCAGGKSAAWRYKQPQVREGGKGGGREGQAG